MDWLQEFPVRVTKIGETEKSCAWDWLPGDWTPRAEFYDKDCWHTAPEFQAAGVYEEYRWVAEGLDALLATVQMPSGIPVATVAINGGVNAALLAAQIIAVGEPELAAKLDAKRVSDAETVLKKDAALQAELNK